MVGVNWVIWRLVIIVLVASLPSYIEQILFAIQRIIIRTLTSGELTLDLAEASRFGDKDAFTTSKGVKLALEFLGRGSG